MSLSRTIKRNIERTDVYLSTHLENKTLPVSTRPTMALAGNTFSAQRRRFVEEARINAIGLERAKLTGVKYEPVKLTPGKPKRVAPRGESRADYRKANSGLIKQLRSATAGRPLDEQMVTALLFNTLPRAVRKGQLSLADYRKGVRV